MQHAAGNMINIYMDRCHASYCFRPAAYNSPHELFGIYCHVHKLPDMICLNMTTSPIRCVGDPLCSLTPTYHVPRADFAMYCSIHKTDTMVIKPPKATHLDEPNSEEEDQEEEETDVVLHKCIVTGCKRTCYFNVKGETKPAYCSEHRTRDMIRIFERTCDVQDCTNKANFNRRGETQGIRCRMHRDQDMIHVVPKRCAVDACDEFPLFCLGKHVFCSRHQQPGMKKRTCFSMYSCFHPHCDTTSHHYNFPGESMGIYCAKHRLPGMIHLKARQCAAPSCAVVPCFNKVGETTGLYCNAHKLPGMVNVHRRLCASPSCKVSPCCNYPNQPIAMYCMKHRAKNMINLYRKPCPVVGCTRFPWFDTRVQQFSQFCKQHHHSTTEPSYRTRRNSKKREMNNVSFVV